MINRRHALGLIAAAGVLPSQGFANVAQQRSEIRDSLAKRFIEEGTAGTFVGYKVEDYLIIASDKDRSGEAKLPASTFKIPNSLIALETGVVEDPDKDIFKWDGVKRDIEAWNRDHTMRSAIAVSAVPVYQEIARRIGQERMQKYVDLLEYGNRNIGGGIDQFWLTGDLRIDPVQQIDFLDRLRRGCFADLETEPGPGARHPAGHQGWRCHHSGQEWLAWGGDRQAFARLDGRVGREGRHADCVCAEHGLPRAPSYRRPHDAVANLPA